MEGEHRDARGVMIDAPGAVDRDDAVWATREGAGWRVWVHIADVASVVRLGSAVDVEACRRGHSRYLPDRTVPMLPAAEQATAALRAGRDRPSLLIMMTIDQIGEIVEVELGPGRLREPVEASYQEAAAALDNPEHPLNRVLRDAHDLARTLFMRRQAAGALARYDLRHGWATDEDGHVVRLAEAERNAGYVIVQELMVAANAAAAAWAAQRGLPLLFRNHQAGTATREELADQLGVAEDAAGWVADREPATHPEPARSGESAEPGAPAEIEESAGLATLRRHLATVLRPAVYEPWLGGHFGLNLSAYTHVTSPLRRYPDLVNQRILAAAAADRPSPYQVETLEEIAAAVNLRHEGYRARRAAGLRSAAADATRAQLVRADYHRLDERGFGKLIRLAVAERRFSQALADEIIRRVENGRLLPRDAIDPLFATRAPQWQSVRQRLLEWLSAEPAHALTLLSLYRQREQAGALHWEEQRTGAPHQPVFRVRLWLGERHSPTRTAPSKRAGRQQAALALVADLAGLPDPSRDLAPDQPPEPVARRRAIPSDHPPVMAVHELAQRGAIKDLRWDFSTNGSPHEPVHTCIVSAWSAAAEQTLTGTGRGSTKAAAKTEAAAALRHLLKV